jgi:hypothetical protein
MEHPLILEPLGIPVTGNIEEGNGSGFRAIGKGLQDPKGLGSPDTGKKDPGVGSGLKGIGSIDDGLSRSLGYWVCRVLTR